MKQDKARLIIDQPGDGAWNMAVDQALLESADEMRMATLRFYGWLEPTLSLGYFQKYADRNCHKTSRNCTVVRRTSGGGAILHDHEITYSLCIPSVSRWSKRNSELYEIVHREIIATLRVHGIESHLFGDSKNAPSSVDRVQPDAFLCFQRRTSGDILIGSKKICGSAQRRLKNSLIQHGSVLLAQSNSAPELVGIHELTDKMINLVEFSRELALRLSECLGIGFDTAHDLAQLSQRENERSRELETIQFGHKHWTNKR